MMITVVEAGSGRFVLANKACEKAFGKKAKIIGNTLHDLLPKEKADSLAERDQAVIKQNRRIDFEYDHTYDDGSKMSLVATMIPISWGSDDERYLLCIHDDVTERRKAQDEIAYLAHYDYLTGLKNRGSFSKQLEESFLRYKDSGAFALIGIDLDNFKIINDSYGHPIGDHVLICVANRLKEIIDLPHHVARLGGDEFAVILNGIPSLERINSAIDQVVEAINQPIDVCARTLAVTASIGIAVAPQDAGNPAALLRNADIALYRAKNEGGNSRRLFNTEMLEKFNERVSMENDLRNAMINNELFLHYQPLVSLEDNRVTGFEALLRWNSPTRGIVSPVDFIPLAEETGLIGPIGAWVLKQACLDARSWPDYVRVAVNVSVVQFRKRSIFLDVAAALGASNLNPNRLELEITESIMLGDTAGTVETLQQLRNLGVKIAMDDFGTGYSSLAYLARFVFDRVKIDRAFVAGVVDKEDCSAIIRAITGLCASLQIPTTAEGVETSAQLERLRAEGCSSVQGYLFGRPAPVQSVHKFLERDPHPTIMQEKAVG